MKIEFIGLISMPSRFTKTELVTLIFTVRSSLLYSAGARYACRLLESSLIIYFQVSWSGSLSLYKEIIPKGFFIICVEKVLSA